MTTIGPVVSGDYLANKNQYRQQTNGNGDIFLVFYHGENMKGAVRGIEPIHSTSLASYA